MSKGMKLVISFVAGAGLAAGVRMATDAWKKRLEQQKVEVEDKKE